MHLLISILRAVAEGQSHRVTFAIHRSVQSAAPPPPTPSTLPHPHPHLRPQPDLLSCSTTFPAQRLM